MPPGRRDPPALLVFIRGRWQSVPPGSGFAVARRGKLEKLHSGTVHGALRRLQFWLPSKARLGPRLSFKKIPPCDRENSDNKVTLTEPKQIPIQNREVRPCQRTGDTTSSEEPIQSVTTVATVHAAKKSKTSKNQNHQSYMIRLLSSESKSSEKSRTDPKKQTSKGILTKSSKKISETSRNDLKKQKTKEKMESPKKSSVSSRILLDSPKRSLNLRRKPVDQTNPSKQSSPMRNSKNLSEKQVSRYLQPKSGKQNRSPKKGDTICSDSDFETDQNELLKSKMKHNRSPNKINNLSNSEFGTKNEKSSSNNQNKLHKIGPKSKKLDQDTSVSQSPKKAENIFLRPNEKYKTQSPKIGTCKELEIDEQDIELLRIFLQNHYSDRELFKFDADDEYKRMVFFRINPLVDIEWCPIIDRMLRTSQDSQITLTDFASSLGLRSVTEAASIKTQRYKIRKRTEKSYIDSGSDSSSEDKENNDKIRRIEKSRLSKILNERENNMRESNPGENEAQESKNKMSNKRVFTRKRAESDSEVSITKENNNKLEKAKERAKIENRNTAESDSETSDAKENNIKAGIPKERTWRANHTVESDSEASNTKKQTKREVRNKEDTDSKASNAIKHNTKVSNAKKLTKREKRNSDDSDSQKSNAKQEDRKEIDNTVDIVELSSASETEQAVKAIKKTTKPKVISSKRRRRSNLVYSNLEDHAIVSWVSTGSRATRVNGNLLWRQLQDQYTQITGSRRTWHSLRNRYLRYILPKLGDLALPLSQQTRLRAAAATGEIKGKVRSPRRNSIFTLPQRGAASRRLSTVNDNTETEDKEVPSKRSPRYSSLTRRFTRRHNLTRPSSELSDTSQRSNKLEVKDGKEKPAAKGNSPKIPYKETNSPHKQTNGKATGRRSESPRRDKDSSDSSSESEDESEETNEPRRTRRSVIESNKRMSRSDTRHNSNVSERRLTRQSNILDGSDESKTNKSLGLADKLKSAREKTNESPRRLLNRHKSPSEQTSRDSSMSMSQSKRKSPVNNIRRSRRDKKNRDESNESKIRKLPIRSNRRSPTRNLNRNKSPSKQSSKGSITSVSQVRHKSKSPIKRKSTRHDSSSEENDSSSGSVSQPRRKSNRINSPNNRSNRRNSNRLISPMKQNGRLSSDSPRRKLNRITPNESSNKRRHSSESKRKSKLAKRDSLDEIVVSDSSESFETKMVKKDLKNKVDQPKKRVVKQRMRKLFNPKTLL